MIADESMRGLSNKEVAKAFQKSIITEQAKEIVALDATLVWAKLDLSNMQFHPDAPKEKSLRRLCENQHLISVADCDPKQLLDAVTKYCFPCTIPVLLN